jgi:hypothetical protein
VFLVGSAMNFAAAVLALAVLKPMRKRFLERGLKKAREVPMPAELPKAIVQS